MNARSAAEVAFAVTGTYLVVSGASFAISATEFAMVAPDKFLGWSNIVGPVGTVLAGASLVGFRTKIAGRLFEDESVEAGRDWIGGAQAAAISVIGAYFFAEGLAQLVRELAFWKLAPGVVGEPSVRQLSEDIARVVIGLALFFGARGITGFWRMLRNGPMPKDS